MDIVYSINSIDNNFSSFNCNKLISKIIAFRSDIFRLRTQWLKKMNDDTASTESKLKILENRFIAKYGSEEFYQI